MATPSCINCNRLIAQRATLYTLLLGRDYLHEEAMRTVGLMVPQTKCCATQAQTSAGTTDEQLAFHASEKDRVYTERMAERFNSFPL